MISDNPELLAQVSDQLQRLNEILSGRNLQSTSSSAVSSATANYVSEAPAAFFTGVVMPADINLTAPSAVSQTTEDSHLQSASLPTASNVTTDSETQMPHDLSSVSTSETTGPRSTVPETTNDDVSNHCHCIESQSTPVSAHSDDRYSSKQLTISIHVFSEF